MTATRSLFTVLLTAFLATIVAGQGGGQGAGSQTASLPPGTGLILGQVVDGLTGNPVGAALVTLNASAIAPVATRGTPAASGGMTAGQPARGAGARPTTETVITDANGRFVFHDLPKATYALTAEYTGYANGALGQRRPGGPSQPLSLDTDQRVVNAKIPLWKLASVSGVVLDDHGDPMVGVTVRAMRRTLALGRRRLEASSSAPTDDRGVYRMPVLQPGDYVISIPSTTQSVPTSMVDDVASAGYRLGDTHLQLANALTRLAPPPAENTKIFTFQTTFFPSTTTISQAQIISLGSGEERTGIDLQMKLVPTSRVSGTLAGPSDVVPGMALRLVQVDAEDWNVGFGLYETAMTSPDAQGRFTFLGVPAGQYMLRAQRVARADAAAAAWWAETPVAVSGADLTNVGVSLREGVRVSGRVEFEGATARPAPDRMQQITVTLVSADGRPAPQAARVGADGQFVTQQHVPGKYTLNVSAPAGWFLKSVMAGARDLSQTSWVLEPSDMSGVVVTYTDRPAQVSGQVQGVSAPDVEALVVMFPANYLQVGDAGFAPRVMRIARPNKAGSFAVTNVPAGDYYIAAVPDALSNDWHDAQVLAKIGRVASRVTLTDGEKRAIDLTFVVIR